MTTEKLHDWTPAEGEWVAVVKKNRWGYTYPTLVLDSRVERTLKRDVVVSDYPARPSMARRNRDGAPSVREGVAIYPREHPVAQQARRNSEIDREAFELSKATKRFQDATKDDDRRALIADLRGHVTRIERAFDPEGEATP